MPSIDVLNSTIFYEDAGSGTSFVFLHGNPTSSHLWRHISPNIGEPARRLAPDLIGMGRSGKPAIPYRFADHARYLDAWFDALELTGVVLVGHDWGGALAFDWAARNPERVRGIAFMETIVRPMNWDDLPNARPRYEALRSTGTGEAKVLDENFFIEQALRATILNGLSDEDHAVYRAPYPTRESRRPLLEWPRAMPIAGEPVDVVARIEAYDAWLAVSADVPKLLLTFDGPAETLLIGERMTDWCRANIANLDIEKCGPARHVAPEDQPEAIAAAISRWADRRNLR
ncbi:MULTISPECIES: haloalkane dehalogenase [unclassified Rhizobium]|uniref:haloalkane dehalogenase n=1 Tax=unclassified Rhizobium TaxID=2613769 RepID=UPI000CDF4541|nr:MULTISPECIES: haloalkane dehalogenase [Rhizobium]AVA23098.1 haloalkane dehalogenase [Rhizobium sp. NXC24]MDK4741802.1 haloalkane dehalogenase [Rhizobium sp. CNPSo 3464]UWU20458.1 haloalkane dehalogenase [Rhizobium tropici]